ncbi:hypothetical protein HID58_060854 [Brassica napus]|uniref:Uncharacterized protein n=1 Tax=Brassica napus TaxID=3708 RepID=A0ABQ7ZX28_BRANA|nr:hypothetical protein HID58_060854 [Brassica napus]
MRIRVIHSLFSAVSRKHTTCFSSSRTQWSQLSPGRTVPLRKRFFLLPPKATTEQSCLKLIFPKVVAFAVESSKFRESFGISFKYDGKAIMSNEEFDNFKEELMWEGISVVIVSFDEHRFLEASMACVSGNLILNDEEFDQLKLKLKMDGSEIVCEGPRCSLRSKTGRNVVIEQSWGAPKNIEFKDKVKNVGASLVKQDVTLLMTMLVMDCVLGNMTQEEAHES